MLERRIRDCGYETKNLAKLLRISEKSLKEKLAGQKEFRLGELAQLCQVLDIADPGPYFFGDAIPNARQERENVP